MSNEPRKPARRNRCKHKEARRIDARFQVFWCRNCGAIKTPSAVTSGRNLWLSPHIAKTLDKEKERAADANVSPQGQADGSETSQPS